MPGPADTEHGDNGKSERKQERSVFRDAFAKAANAYGEAETEERVRAGLGLWLLVVLIVLVFVDPADLSDGAKASVQTLTFAVIAFYFGLHKGTPAARARREDEQRGRRSGASQEKPPDG